LYRADQSKIETRTSAARGDAAYSNVPLLPPPPVCGRLLPAFDSTIRTLAPGAAAARRRWACQTPGTSSGRTFHFLTVLGDN